MALPWVLLDRRVSFVKGEAAVYGGARRHVERFGRGAGKAAAAFAGSSRVPSPREAMAAMKPNPLGRGVDGGEISSTNKNLVVLYSGRLPTWQRLVLRGRMLHRLRRLEQLPLCDPPASGVTHHERPWAQRCRLFPRQCDRRRLQSH
ncbi:hypothetical protein BAE44_0001145 [Dichanthelium oligosanthes]|uniref:Uncharacterized protein n=1 Tax=Dichanthelium oligosanthes TaxID=888268 RepID=A0A1E5WKC6_9POAL|nr:hypothetical protein BAE44_0001145 [Dichanthelium oligosanthes]